MATIGSLAVRITADSSGLTRGLNDASREVTTFKGRMDGLATQLGKFGPIAVAAGAALGVSMVKNIIDTGDALAKMSQRTGIAVEDLSRLQYAADLSGVSTGTLNTSLNILSRNMAEAATGTGDAAEAFNLIGVSIKNADGSLRNQNDVLRAVADRFATYQDGAAKSALAMKLFGRGAAELIPLLNAGSKGLDEMGQQSDAFGKTITRDVAKASERLKDDLTKIQAAATGAATQIAGPLIKSLADLTERFEKASKEGKGFLGTLKKMVDDGVDVNAELAVVELTMKAVQNRLERLTASFKANSEALKKNQENSDGLFSEEMLQQINKDAEAIARANQQLKELEERRARLKAPQGFVGPPAEAAADARTNVSGAKVDYEQRERDVQALLANIEAIEIQAAIEKNKQLEALTNESLARDAMLRQEYLMERLQSFQQGLLTEVELENQAHMQRLVDLEAMLENKFLAQEQYNALLEALELQHQERMTEITDKENKRREDLEANTQRTIDQMRQQAFRNAIGLLGMFAGKSKAAALAQIALNRGLMIAQTIQNTAAAQTRAFADLPYPAAVAAAAKIGALGKANVALIAATGLAEAANVGGGSMGAMGAVGSVGGGGTTAGTSAGIVAAPQQIANINVTGESFSRGQVVSLIQTINELSQDGVRLVIQ
jgi:hypothetical protein